jgi:hypothetical protein
MQSNGILKQWYDINNSSTSVCVGGVVFEMMDEWWKGSQTRTPLGVCPELDPAVHSVCGQSMPGADDGFYSESWFGLFAQTEEYTCIVPRKAFYNLGKLWTGAVVQERCQNQSCCIMRDPSVLPLLGGLLACIIIFGSLYAAWKYASKRSGNDDDEEDANDAKPATENTALRPNANVSATSQGDVKLDFQSTGRIAVVAHHRGVIKEQLPAVFGSTAYNDVVSPRSVTLRLLEDRLDRCFNSCSLSHSFTLTTTPLGFISHCKLQRATVTNLITQQLMRCGYASSSSAARICLN